MRINSKVKDIVGKVFHGLFLTREEITFLLEMDGHSLDAGFIMGAAHAINRIASKGRAEVHVQIGLNLSPCPNNCSFCSFSASNGLFTEKKELPIDEVVGLALRTERDGANALFLMATGDYPFGRYVEIAKEIKTRLKPDTLMIANTGDFGYSEGKRLKDAGFAGIYHAVRMGEGKDTNIAPQTRFKTIQAARETGLWIGTCVEPVGPEHTIEEITEKILIGREINPCYSGAARRISIPGTPLEPFGMISEYRMAFLVAIVRLAMGQDLMGNCTHEPNVLGAATGANLFWAEAGTNPRDTEADTSRGRGLDLKACIRIFQEADWDILQGPSVFYSECNSMVP